MMVKATETQIYEEVNGGCVNCGTIVFGGVEPDARGYECPECSENTVYGLEELVIMGMLDLSDEEE